MSETTQYTLSGGEAETGYTRPETMMYCPECDYWLLRRHRHTHEHEVFESPEDFINALDAEERTYLGESKYEDDDSTDDDDEPREVGGMFSVTYVYSARHSFTVAAGDEDQAKKLAQEQIEWGTCHDADHLHTDVHKNETLTEDDERMDDVPGWPW